MVKLCNRNIIFNDHEENLDFKKGDELKRMRIGKKNSVISMVSMDLATGEFNREMLVDVEKRDMICVPQKSFKLDDQVLLVAEKKKTNKFGTVTFLD